MEQTKEITGTRVVYRVKDKQFKSVREIVETYEGELQEVMKEVMQRLERPTTWITLHPEDEEDTHIILKIKSVIDVEIYPVC